MWPICGGDLVQVRLAHAHPTASPASLLASSFVVCRSGPSFARRVARLTSRLRTRLASHLRFTRFRSRHVGEELPSLASATTRTPPAFAAQSSRRSPRICVPLTESGSCTRFSTPYGLMKSPASASTAAKAGPQWRNAARGCASRKSRSSSRGAFATTQGAPVWHQMGGTQLWLGSRV